MAFANGLSGVCQSLFVGDGLLGWLGGLACNSRFLAAVKRERRTRNGQQTYLSIYQGVRCLLNGLWQKGILNFAPLALSSA